jgi:tRNA pseudouridine55 synthase
MSAPAADGLCLVDKQPGPSSARVVSTLKKRYRLDKVGHAGTLDPFASGLLICLTGRCTRLAQWAGAGLKRYSGVIRLGLKTVTDDVTGDELRRSDAIPDFQTVRAVALSLEGASLQLPPQISAVKVNGQRAYDIARGGEHVELSARPVNIRGFELWALDREHCGFRVEVTKGTYIRSIARDLGEQLGCGACLSELRRESSLPFTVEQAGKLDPVEPGPTWIDWTTLFPEAAYLDIDSNQAEGLSRGDERVLRQLRGQARDIYAASCPEMLIYRTHAQSAAGLIAGEKLVFHLAQGRNLCQP